jgi:hypothetical protein
VAAEHDHHAAFTLMRADDCVDDSAKISRDEHIGERAQKRSERSIVARSVREFFRANFVWPAGDGNGSNRGEVRLVAR